MKVAYIVFSIFFLIFGIENIDLSSLNDMFKEDKKESYKACLKLRMKANINLKCDHLLEKNVEDNKKDENSNTEIKKLIISETHTRKVNKSQEMKLRNLIKKLADGNKIRKD